MRGRGGCDILPWPGCVVPTFRVSSRTLGVVEVEATNWLVALGEGLERLGAVAALNRIACEVLPNGTTLVRDVRTGSGFIVQPLGEPVPEGVEPTDEVALPPPVTDARLPDGFVGWIDTILHAPDTRAALRTALEAAMGCVRCEGGAVLLEQHDGALLFAAAAGPEAARLKDVLVPAGSGVAGFSVDHAVALTVNEPYRDERFYADVDRRTGVRTRSILCVPVAVESRVFGCIELINALAPNGFPSRALGDVSLVGDALAERLARG